jgi:competence protein ComEC
MKLILLCSAALLGIAVGDVGHIAEPLRLLFAAFLALVGACLTWRPKTWRWLALCTCALALGALRAATSDPPRQSALEPYIDQLIRLSGRLSAPPILSSSGTSVRLILDVATFGPAGSDANLTSGQALGSLAVVGDPALFGELETGDYLVLEGHLRAAASRSPLTLLFPRLIAHHAENAPGPLDWLANLRTRASAGIRRYLPEPHGSLAAGLLLGGSGQLDPDFRLQLQRSGLAHLVAIDGYKQVIVAAALGTVFVRAFGVRLASVPILLGIAGYTLLTGAHPSAVRAALMVGLALLAALTGRVADPLTSLLLAVLGMGLLEPRILLDVGLQLSLSATLGIILLWPRLRRQLRGIPGWIAEPAGLTLAVTLATLPVMLSVFQSVSLVSPLAHVLAVPLLPAALASTALLASVSSVAPLANVVAWLAWLPSTLLVEVIRVLGSLPGAALSTGRLPAPAAFGLAAALLAWGMWGLPEAREVRLRWARLRLPRRRYAVPAVGVCTSLLAVGTLHMVGPDARLHVEPLSAGRGQAVLIRGPTGRTALVVAGRVDSALLVSQVADHLAVWEHKLSAALALDAASDAGLGPTLARYPADQRISADHDDRVDLGGGAVLDVYVTTTSSSTEPSQVTVSYGQVWLRVLGRSPPLTSELVSDGTAVWSPNSDGD